MKYVYHFSKELFACGIPFLKKHLMTSCRVVLSHSNRWNRLAPSQLWWLCCYPWSWILWGWGPLIEGCRISVKWEWWSQQEWGKFLLPRVIWIFTASFMAIRELPAVALADQTEWFHGPYTAHRPDVPYPCRGWVLKCSCALPTLRVGWQLSGFEQ